MAAPTVVGSAVYNAGTLSSHDITLPGSIVSGDLLQMVISWGSGTVGQDLGVMTGWTKQIEPTDQSTALGGACWFRNADGTEGATVNYNGQGSDQLAAVTARIQGHDSAIAPEVTGAFADSANPNAPSNTPTGGSKDYLWLVGLSVDGGRSITVDPSSYTQVNVDAIEAGQCTAYMAERALTAASEDPGAATISASDDWYAFTIAVHPAAGAAGANYRRAVDRIGTHLRM